MKNKNENSMRAADVKSYYGFPQFSHATTFHFFRFFAL